MTAPGRRGGRAAARSRPARPLGAREEAAGTAGGEPGGERPEPVVVERGQPELGGHRADLDAPERVERRAVGARRGQHEPAGRGAGGGRGGDEDRAEEQPRARPQRHRGRGEQHAGVGAEVAADDRVRRTERARLAAAAEQVGADGSGGEAAERGQRPDPEGHRRARLEDAQHLVEALGPPEVHDQQRRRRRERGQRDLARGRRRALVAGEVAGERDERRARRDPAEPEVERHLPRPHRRVHDRPLDLLRQRLAAARAAGRVADGLEVGHLARGVVRVLAVEVRPAAVVPLADVQVDLRAAALAERRAAGRADRGRDVAVLAHRRPHRNAAATPAAATSPAPIAAAVAGTTFSRTGESACAGSP